jgi:hypothetical protein
MLGRAPESGDQHRWPGGPLVGGQGQRWQASGWQERRGPGTGFGKKDIVYRDVNRMDISKQAMAAAGGLPSFGRLISESQAEL